MPQVAVVATGHPGPRGSVLYSAASAGRLHQKIKLGEAVTHTGSSFTVFGQHCWLEGRGLLG